MPDQFWIDEYRRKAALDNPIAQSGRGREFEPVEFLYVIKQAIDALAVQREHDVLDVGCANGLFDIVLSACCRSLLAIEPVPELAALAARNLEACTNVRVEVGHGGAVPAEDASFDRILVIGVLQLVPPREAESMFHELRRVLRPGGAILFGSVPDARRRDAFLQPYLDGVRRASHLSDAQKADIIARNTNAHWYDPADLDHRWRALGCATTVRPLPQGDPNADHRYHLLVSR